MAKAFTYSATRSFVRLELIKQQIRVMLLRAASISDSYLDSIVEGVDRRWISKVFVYALDAEGLCRGQVTIRIDWAVY